MKVFSADQMKRWDAASICEQDIHSFELMERAAHACYEWLVLRGFTKQPICIFCGKGNNGGDGLALAAILVENNIHVSVYILESGKPGKPDFQHYLQKLHAFTKKIHFIQPELFFPPIQENEIVVDALFGTGLNKPLTDLAAGLAVYLNNSKATIISIDIPSGLFTDTSTKNNIAINASYTLSFQGFKLAFLFAENNDHVGDLHILDIGLSNSFESLESSFYEIIDIDIIRAMLRPANKFSHKGNFGHAALVAGSQGMIGAAVLSAKACLHSGVGKLTCYVPACGYEIMQATVPEAMCNISGKDYISLNDDVPYYNALGIGPGISTRTDSSKTIEAIFKSNKNRLIIDADALNILASDEKLLLKIPAGSLITPHPKEFERLFGASANDFERMNLALKKAAELNIYIILKGHYSMIITPLGKLYFNNTGNAGMAKGGMGDVLTGIITGLIAQGYLLPEAAMLGCYLHGLAGDIAADKCSAQAMQASDLIHCLGDAWKYLYA